MENITSTDELLEKIQILETEQAGHLYEMKEKFGYTVERLKPVNIIGDSLKEMVSSPKLVNNILGLTVGLFTGYVSRKAVFAGVANNKYRRVLGNVLQLGVTSLIARNPKIVQIFRNFVSKRIARKRERYSTIN